MNFFLDCVRSHPGYTLASLMWWSPALSVARKFWDCDGGGNRDRRVESVTRLRDGSGKLNDCPTEGQEGDREEQWLC